MTEISCAFTGHRSKSFPWGYDESASGCVLLKEALAAQISALAEQGVTDFLSGMAQGVDLWCAQIVLDLKKKNSALKLHCILPCKGWENKWTTSAQALYHSILEQADRWSMSAKPIIRAVCLNVIVIWQNIRRFCWPFTTGHGAAALGQLCAMPNGLGELFTYSIQFPGQLPKNRLKKGLRKRIILNRYKLFFSESGSLLAK